MHQNKILKYLTYGALFTALLYFISTNAANFDSTKAVASALLLVIAVAVLDMFVFSRSEGMTMVLPVHEEMPMMLSSQGEMCDGAPIEPKQYTYESTEEGDVKSGIEYDSNLPGYYLINNGNYSGGNIPYNKASELMAASVYNDLYNQHNFNIIWSPHTHVGKARGYLNWDKIVD